MFDILEADVVVFQEIKIQRKDLSDDMVLVPGWDCYFSLPRHKKGYSGVVIYTRQSVCAPIRAEEGITGVCSLPNSSTSFLNLPAEQQIGGYPTPAQLSAYAVDAATLDSEGRCVILEFPAFVLVGVYSPANRDETRDDFRLAFLGVLDARIRNLDAMGKRVFLTGDLNVSREELDASNAEASMRKQGLTRLDFISTPARRLFNQLLYEGKVSGERDEGRERPVMWDICRAFHPDRKGMFTCWEQKVNARPANCGARIDYVLCNVAMKDWFSDSNIQEGLMGSDHCPVYATLKDKIRVDGQEYDTLDLMNPPGMFVNGRRQRVYSTSLDLLPSSGKLIPEFSGRRNIRDMFSRSSSLLHSKGCSVPEAESVGFNNSATMEERKGAAQMTSIIEITNSSPSTPSKKRGMREGATGTNLKRSKPSSALMAPEPAVKGQRSLKGFFKADVNEAPIHTKPGGEEIDKSPHDSTHTNGVNMPSHILNGGNDSGASSSALESSPAKISDVVHDPVESMISWSKLFTKPIAPRCEGHDEPCINLLTKKPGMNLGRSFWMCPRPLGPSGGKEKNTQWRCQTFIWCSDWDPHTASPR